VVPYPLVVPGGGETLQDHVVSVRQSDGWKGPCQDRWFWGRWMEQNNVRNSTKM